LTLLDQSSSTLPPRVAVHKNFISKEETLKFLEIFKDYKEKFIPYNSETNKTNVLGFGQDNFDSSPFFTNPNSASLLMPEKVSMLREYCLKIEEAVKLDSNMDISPATLWFAETCEGFYHPHGDNVDEALYQYDYVCILYLNDMKVGGEIVLPDYNYKFKPSAGSLITFPADYVHAVNAVVESRYAMPCWFTSDKNYSIEKYL
jgi:hypothetical protein